MCKALFCIAAHFFDMIENSFVHQWCNIVHLLLCYVTQNSLFAPHNHQYILNDKNVNYDHAWILWFRLFTEINKTSNVFGK